ncbi:hypothetical protein BHU72_09425 [Desulfuribacillus stibiiarsenatis]|uniref:Diguanylate cyclase n=1 Tax=Desulfuribacillus stibiiarsenatis TaxID=1390249 RepID=A0A1E5L2R8_9FIRM|nr:HD domain-containing phosphohydrolase [Desulfuribacillus stibiiarsenatis]OEH84428.1 hypothetical protein BHU72_09425 [Desulfuribacillus stibiiarsenatis]
MDQELNVLFIEDSENDVLLLKRAMENGGFKIRMKQIQTKEELLFSLMGHDWDVIISDYSMPNFDAFSALRTLQEVGLDIPFIVVSGTILEELAVEIMKAGAHDYIMKDNTIRLIPAVRREIQEANVRRLKRIVEENLRDNERKFRTLAENSLDYILRINSDGVIIYANQKVLTRCANGSSFNRGMKYDEIEIFHDLEVIRKAMNHVFNKHGPARIETQTNIAEWIDWQLVPEFDVDNHIRSVMVVGRDITERKIMEEELKYLSTHDPLTGLHNRIYLEHQLKRLNHEMYLPIGFLICDVDGLKIINDSFGHDVGDKLLQEVGQIIKKGVPLDAISTRIGGDEFAILLPNTSREGLLECMEDIRTQQDLYNQNNPQLPISISIGYAINTGENNLLDTYREADNFMYREKLHEKRSTRSGIVQLLIKALEVRDFETEKHTERMEELVVLMAKHVNLPESQIVDLRLFARFHDIGKVGIPDEILFKTGKLTETEWEKMKQHSEIGFRIAMSAPELKHIANFILKHHEWWNGKGYPLGIKGEGIPIECRMLAIADAFDAMTSNRPYRDGMAVEAAVQELQRYAGTQFDPALVEVFISSMQSSSIQPSTCQSSTIQQS